MELVNVLAAAVITAELVCAVVAIAAYVARSAGSGS